MHETYPFYQSGSFVHLPVIISNPDTGLYLPVLGLVDTGADCCVISRSLCERLGHEFDGKLVKISTTAGIGGETLAYQHTFEIDLFNEPLSESIWQSGSVPVDCIDGLNDDVPVLLGVRGFLENFSITVDYLKRQTVLKT
jgi:predicted aspartyl protease